MSSRYKVMRGGVELGVFTSSELKDAALSRTLRKTDKLVSLQSGSSYVAGDVSSILWPPDDQTMQAAKGSESSSSPVDLAADSSTLDEIDASSAGRPNLSLEKSKDLQFRCVDNLVEQLKLIHSNNHRLQDVNRAQTFGNYLLQAQEVFLVFAFLYLAIKIDSLLAVFGAALIVPIYAVLQWLANSSIHASSKLLHSSPNYYLNSVVLDGAGVLFTTSAAILILAGSYIGIRFDSFLVVVSFAILAAFFWLCASVCMNAEVLNLRRSEEASAGDEAISLVSFLFKISLFLSPFSYFLLMLLSSFWMYLSINKAIQAFDDYQGLSALFSSSSGDLAAADPTLQIFSFCVNFIQAFGLGFAAPVVTLFACLVPVINYVYFLIFYLVVDLLRSIFSIERHIRKAL